MSWLQQLYDTYEACSQVTEFVSGDNPLLPICHTTQNAHLEVVINQKGEFLRAKVLEKNDLLTVVPCTEGSAGRSGSKPVHHPLCDKLQYVAGDYVTFGGTVTVGYSKNPQEPYQNYLNDLSEWVESDDTHPKIQAIYNYVKQGRLIADLVKAQCLYLNTQGQLIKQWEKKPDSKEDAPAIFKIMPAGQTIEAAFIRWVVEVQGEREPRAWQDVSLRKAWISFYSKRDAIQGLCMVTGETLPLANQHPSGIRHGADKAKLISSNDSAGYTFRGRFTDSEGSQACTVSSEVSQKAHNALRWLVQRKQAYRLGDQAFIVWAKAGETVPSLLENTQDEFDIGGDDFEEISVGDVGQAYADRLRKKIAGYAVYVSDTQRILLMGVDSATPGRMAITFYRELTKSEFFERLEAWHQKFAWFQHYEKNKKFIGAPSPKDIAEAAYGRRLDENLKKATVVRLLPCIVDQVSLPPYLVRSVVNRASNKSAFPPSDMEEWEKVLGIACALVRGTHKEEMKMGLDEERTTRDYLYGRLLAVADNIERRALEYSKEKRDTNAGRLMQRFSTHPFETWKNIELALKPYIDRLRVNDEDADFLSWNEYLLRHIMLKFEPDDFAKPNTPLSSEFLLAFHSQSTRFFNKKTDQIKKQDPTNITDESDH